MDDDLRKKGKHLLPVVRVGKSGLTDSLIAEIKKHLKKKRLIKVKFLKSALVQGTVKEFAEVISEKTGSEIVFVIGLNAVFHIGKRK